ncbi:MAG: ATP-binding protein [Armatimonadota bacterium]|nr:ATP-binding protein [Armatimonadota bacterium]
MTANCSRQENIGPAQQDTGTLLLEYWLPADAKSVPEARRQAQQICEAVGVSDDECFSLDLALGEALANAVVHGTPSPDRPEPSDHHVFLGMWDYDHHLIVEVHDRGPGFRPPPPPYQMPAPDTETTHGRGLPLMQMLTDAMIVCRGDAERGGASIYLVKHLEHRHRN